MNANGKTNRDKPKRELQTDRLPPHGAEAEAGVLGCCLLDPATAIDDVSEVITQASAFYDLRHQVIWGALVKLRAGRSGPAAGMENVRDGVESVPTMPVMDLITVMQELRDAGNLDEIGGVNYLEQCRESVPSAANLPMYLEIVKEKWMLRRLLHTCTAAAVGIYEHEGEVQTLLDTVERDIMRVTETRESSKPATMAECLRDASENVLEKFQRGVKFKMGPSLGFNYLDNIIPGLAPGTLTVIAARPGNGKSAMAMQVAEHMAEHEKVPVGFFSLEMTSRSLALRAQFQRAGVNRRTFLNGFLTDADVADLAKASAELAKLPIQIDQSSRLAVEDFEVRARRMVRNGVKVIFVDYFQLMFVRQQQRQWSRADEMAQVSMRIKGLTMELNVPIVLLAQLNREIDKDTERCPRLSDLKDTGQLEQDADVAMFLYRPDLTANYWREKRIPEVLSRAQVPEEWKGFYPETGGGKWRDHLTIMKCAVQKQRDGESGVEALMLFIKPWTRFADAYNPAKGSDNEREETLISEGMNQQPSNEENEAEEETP